MSAATIGLTDAANSIWDAVVIGAGPAGSMAAREAARRGARVLLVDRATFPRDKVCGGCLSRRGIRALERMGLASLLEARHAQPLRRMALAAGGRRANLGLPGGAVISRGWLDAALIDAAVRAGVAFLPDSVATLGALGRSARTVHLQSRSADADIAARVVVAAGGLGDRRALRHSEIVPNIAADARVGAGVIVNNAPPEYKPGTIFMGVSSDGYVGVAQLVDQRLDVGAALNTSALKGDGNMGTVAARVLRSAGLPPIPGLEQLPWRGTPGLTRRPSRVAAKRLLLIGDAAGYVEPFTGEGMACALDCAWAAGELIPQGAARWDDRLERAWTDQHRRMIRQRQALCRATSAMLRRPGLVQMAIGVLAFAPVLASPLVHWINRPPRPLAS